VNLASDKWFSQLTSIPSSFRDDAFGSPNSNVNLYSTPFPFRILRVEYVKIATPVFSYLCRRYTVSEDDTVSQETPSSGPAIPKYLTSFPWRGRVTEFLILKQSSLLVLPLFNSLPKHLYSIAVLAWLSAGICCISTTVQLLQWIGSFTYTYESIIIPETKHRRSLQSVERAWLINKISDVSCFMCIFSGLFNDAVSI
jgi:hypothetical protein